MVRRRALGQRQRLVEEQVGEEADQVDQHAGRDGTERTDAECDRRQHQQAAVDRVVTLLYGRGGGG
ncbi:hypothetical protein D3C72_1870050 [compost metagenome]